MSGPSFVSTTIPYVNGRPHLGHALEYVQADAYARHLARRGDDVLFSSGSDENSLKNVLAAERLGMSTMELVNQNVVCFERLIEQLSVRVDRFVRTSVDPDHLAGAVEFWRRMVRAGDIYTKEYTGRYCVGCEQFFTEAELVEGRCPDHRTVPELVSERNYFFRLSRYQHRILEALDSGALRITPAARLNEVTSFIRGGLEDISVSRSVQRARGWGIAVPDDPGQVMYVWIDALTNYVNGLGFVRDAGSYHRYWVAASRRVHLVGKGVLRFHAVYWPAMLMSAGVPLPTDIAVHGYLTLSGQKLSKSLGHVVDPAALVDRFGVTAVRYYLLAEIAPFGDGDFSESRLVHRYNSDLANGLGNLVSRVTSMVCRYRGGVVPRSVAPAGADLAATDLALADLALADLALADLALAERVLASSRACDAAMDRHDPREALARIWDLVRAANAYVDERAPWHLAKSTDETAGRLLDTTLHHLVAAVRQVGVLLAPFLPTAGELVLGAVRATEDPLAPAERWLDGLAGREIVKAPALFPRLDLWLDAAEGSPTAG